MDEFYINSNYSSGWKRIKREDADKEQQKAFDILQHDPQLAHVNKQILDSQPTINRKNVGSTGPMLTFMENQKEIIEKINQLQVEMSAMKELFSNIQTNTEMIKGPVHKHATGNKLSRFFK